MIFAAIDRQRDEFPVTVLCRVLGVSASGYYAWRERPPSAREVENQGLTERIRTIWERFRGLYGAPRIHAELLAEGVEIGRKRVARLMRAAGLQGKRVQQRRPRTTQADESHPVVANVLDRQFEATQPDAVWLTDITYVETDEGWLYVAGVLDLYTRQIVGLSMADHLRTELVEGALDLALGQRPGAEGGLHHSDRGSQYTSAAYQQRLQEAGLEPSMSRRGDCLDNAPMESFWATLKRECDDRCFATLNEARSEIFHYIFGFYNRIRRHSALGYLSPIDFEQQFWRQFDTTQK